RADEAIMQSHALPTVPVIVGPDRLAAATRFFADHGDHRPSYWLLDDGFQHRQIARALNIVLVDAARPLGNGRLLPRGPLREQPSALRRADLLVFTRATETLPDAVARDV